MKHTSTRGRRRIGLLVILAVLTAFTAGACDFFSSTSSLTEFDRAFSYANTSNFTVSYTWETQEQEGLLGTNVPYTYETELTHDYAVFAGTVKRWSGTAAERPTTPATYLRFFAAQNDDDGYDIFTQYWTTTWGDTAKTPYDSLYAFTTAFGFQLNLGTLDDYAERDFAKLDDGRYVLTNKNAVELYLPAVETADIADTDLTQTPILTVTLASEKVSRLDVSAFFGDQAYLFSKVGGTASIAEPNWVTNYKALEAAGE
jgi:hypothetical protein